MFSTKLKFPSDCLMKWFDKQFKSENLELSLQQKKNDYGRKHCVDWENRKRCICNFYLEINTKRAIVLAKEMNYLEFFIRRNN